MKANNNDGASRNSGPQPHTAPRPKEGTNHKGRLTKTVKSLGFPALAIVALATAILAIQAFDIRIDIAGKPIFAHNGELAAPVQTQNFALQLNEYLASCAPDAQGMCEVPINVQTNNPILLEGLHIYYTMPDQTIPQNTTSNNQTQDNQTNTTQTNITQENQPPTAAFSLTPDSRTAPLSIQFDASASSDPDGTIAEYEWLIEGGPDHPIPSHTRQAGYTFTAPGTYAITLKVTDDKGARAQATKQLTINEAPNTPPTAAFTIDPQEGDAPLRVTFDAADSTDPDGRIVQYAWNLDDGETSGGVLTRHTYTTPGNKTARLTVTDNRGATGTTTRNVTVRQRFNQPPTAIFTVSPATGRVPMRVTLDASASSDPDGQITLHGWDFGDSTQGSGRIAEHTYTTAGTYRVTLAVQDNDGAQASARQTVEAKPANRPPVVQGYFYTLPRFSQPRVFMVQAYDLDGDPLRYAIDGLNSFYHADQAGNMRDMASAYNPSPYFGSWLAGGDCSAFWGTLRVSDGKDETKSSITVNTC